MVAHPPEPPDLDHPEQPGEPFARRRCPPNHAGADEAQASLAAWTRFEYRLARELSAEAARLHPAWLPLKLIFNDLPDE